MLVLSVMLVSIVSNVCISIKEEEKKKKNLIAKIVCLEQKSRVFNQQKITDFNTK